ncbi:MAG: MotA/TolQ/ExbB proton channel family protein [Candidatus Coatesbacteria bacterium]
MNIADMGFWQLVSRGGGTMWLLIACSVISLGVMLERFIYFRRCRINVHEFFLRFRRTHKKGDDLGALIVLCDETPGPLPALLKEGVRRVMEKPVRRDELEAQLQRHARWQIVEMEKFLSILATMGAISPFIGLYGTVLGVMNAFRDLASAGSGGATVVASGIAQALVATAAGLLVAIPAVAAYNYFIRVVRRTATELELGIGEALDVLAPGK